jgi:DNA invertase Pin-like site-specific DNA recombinase
MPTYGYIRTSRDQEPGHPGSDPEVQRRQLVDTGVEPGRIYADVAVSGATPDSSRAQWHILDQLLAQGDLLVVAAVDRLGRRYLETMWAIYDLQRRGVRLRSLAGNEGEWTKFLDADPDSPEAFMGNILASMAAYVASQERQNISRRTRAGLDAAREKGVDLGRPRRLTNEQLIAIRQDVEEGMPVAAVARKYGVPRSTLRSTLGRTE